MGGGRWEVGGRRYIGGGRHAGRRRESGLVVYAVMLQGAAAAGLLKLVSATLIWVS